MPKPKANKSKFDHIRKYLTKSRSASIQEIVREPTSGGVIFRHGESGIEILLIQDAKDRWTIPKSHIEEGETAAPEKINVKTELSLTEIQAYSDRKSVV